MAGFQSHCEHTERTSDYKTRLQRSAGVDRERILRWRARYINCYLSCRKRERERTVRNAAIDACGVVEAIGALPVHATARCAALIPQKKIKRLNSVHDRIIARSPQARILTASPTGDPGGFRTTVFEAAPKFVGEPQPKSLASSREGRNKDQRRAEKMIAAMRAQHSGRVRNLLKKCKFVSIFKAEETKYGGRRRPQFRIGKRETANLWIGTLKACSFINIKQNRNV